MATITEDYVSFEIAKLLKEKGFDCETDMYYSPEGELKCWIPNGLKSRLDNKGKETWWCKCVAPTLQMAMKWLREVHNINIDIVPIWNQKRFEYQVFVVTPENAKHCYIDDKLYLGYEQACEAAIKYCLENLI